MDVVYTVTSDKLLAKMFWLFMKRATVIIVKWRGTRGNVLSQPDNHVQAVLKVSKVFEDYDGT